MAWKRLAMVLFGKKPDDNYAPANLNADGTLKVDAGLPATYPLPTA